MWQPDVSGRTEARGYGKGRVHEPRLCDGDVVESG